MRLPLKEKMIFSLLLVLFAYFGGQWSFKLPVVILGFWVVVLLIERLGIQEQTLREPKKPRRNKKAKDEIPADPTRDDLIRLALERAAHVGTTPLRSNNGHSGPAQMTLWGTTEPVRSEQIVRTVPEEPEWFRDQFKR